MTVSGRAAFVAAAAITLVIAAVVFGLTMFSRMVSTFRSLCSDPARGLQG